MGRFSSAMLQSGNSKQRRGGISLTLINYSFHYTETSATTRRMETEFWDELGQPRGRVCQVLQETLNQREMKEGKKSNSEQAVHTK